MYQFISADEPRQQYAELVRSRVRQRLERQVTADGRRRRSWRLGLTRRFLGGVHLERRKIIGRIVGA